MNNNLRTDNNNIDNEDDITMDTDDQFEFINKLWKGLAYPEKPAESIKTKRQDSEFIELSDIERFFAMYERRNRHVIRAAVDHPEVIEDHLLMFINELGYSKIANTLSATSGYGSTPQDVIARVKAACEARANPNTHVAMITAVLNLTHGKANETIMSTCDDFVRDEKHLPDAMRPVIPVPEYDNEEIRQAVSTYASNVAARWKNFWCALFLQRLNNYEFAVNVLTSLQGTITFERIIQRARELESSFKKRPTSPHVLIAPAADVSAFQAAHAQHPNKKVTKPCTCPRQMTYAACWTCNPHLKPKPGSRHNTAKHSLNRNKHGNPPANNNNKRVFVADAQEVNQEDNQEVHAFLTKISEKTNLTQEEILEVLRDSHCYYSNESNSHHWAIFDTGATHSICSSAWLEQTDCPMDYIQATTSTQVSGINGHTPAKGKITVLMHTNKQPIAISCLILRSQAIIPPLVSPNCLPPYTLSSVEKKLSFADGTFIRFNENHTSNLLKCAIALPWQASANLSAQQEPIVQELHKEMNHAPAKKVHRYLPPPLRHTTSPREIASILQACETCALFKDKHGRPIKNKKIMKETDMAGVDIVEFTPKSGEYVAALVTRHRLTGLYGARLLQSHTEDSIRNALRSIFGEELPIPTIIRVDGEKGFTIRVRTTLEDKGVIECQTSPAYNHTANGYAENSIKHVIEATRCVLADKHQPPGEWATALPIAIRRLNNTPDDDGKTPIMKSFGVNGLTYLTNRLLPSPPPFPVNTRVIYHPPNRKERPGFNKLAQTAEHATVTQIIDSEVCRITTDKRKDVTCLIKNLRRSFLPDTPRREQTTAAVINAPTLPLETDSTQSKAPAVQNEPSSTEAIQVGEVRVFTRDGMQFIGEVTAINPKKKMCTVQVLSKQTPKGQVQDSWTKTWIETSTITQQSWARYGDQEPLPKHSTMKPFLHDVSLDKVLHKITWQDGNRYSSPDITDGRLFIGMASQVQCFLSRDTTHQKVNYKKLSPDEQLEAKKAFDYEVEKFKKYGVYKPVPLSSLTPDARLVRAVVVFTRKRINDKERKMKCRMTADGSRVQMEDTTTKNASMEELRLLFAMASTSADYNGDVRTADAEQGYLQVTTDHDDIYMIPPSLHDDFNKGFVWKICTNLYGLPDGGAVFERRVRSILQQVGWQQICGLNHSWIKKDKENNIEGFLSVYVDDFCCIGAKRKAHELLSDIGKHLIINIQSATDVRFVGNDFTFGEEGCHNQNDYIKSIADNNAPGECTPLPVRENEKQDRTTPLSDKERTQAKGILGQLLFVSRDSRPDLSYPTSLIGRQIARATCRTRQLLQRIARYAADHPLAIRIPTKHISPSLHIVAYVDASLGSAEENHGQTGWIITANGFPLMWRSKKQSRIARSSAKAELIALHDVADAVEFIKELMGRMSIPVRITIRSDARDVIEVITRNSRPRERADVFRITDIRQSLGIVQTAAVKSTVQQNNIIIEHIKGDANPADALTKAVDNRQLQLLTQLCKMHASKPSKTSTTARKREKAKSFTHQS